MQAANEALLKLLQVPKAVPQHTLPQQQQQGVARPANVASTLPGNLSSGQHAASTATAASSQLPVGALQVQQQRPQQLLHQQHQLQLQQQAQAAQLWQLRQGLMNAAAALPSGVSFLQSPAASTSASLGPLAAQISAAVAPLASLSGASQATAQPGSKPAAGLTLPGSLVSIPANVVLPGVPVSAPVLSQTAGSPSRTSVNGQQNESAQ